MKLIRAEGLMADLIEGLGGVQLTIYERTGRRGILSVTVDSEIGLAAGILPGTQAIFYTACGPVQVLTAPVDTDT